MKLPACLLILAALAASAIIAGPAAATPALDVKITSGPEGTVASGNATVAFEANEFASFECSLDGAALSPCDSPQSYSGLADGDHSFTVKATDRERRNSDSDSRRWTVRRPPPAPDGEAPPDTSITDGPPPLTSATAAMISFASDRAEATFQCSVDGGAFGPCTSPVGLSGLAQGAHVLRARAVVGGLVDPTPAELAWTVRRVTFVPPSRGPSGKVPSRLPVYEVTGAGFTPSQAAALSRALSVSGRGMRKPDGSLAFLDAQGFQKLPTVMVDARATPDEDGGTTFVERFDFEAINRLEPLGAAAARSRATAALRKAGVPFDGAGKVTSSEFAAFGRDGRKLAQVKVDTSVAFPRKLSGLPLVGPGAKSELTFDGNGGLTRLRLAGRRLKMGERVPLLSAKQADDLARRYYNSGDTGACGGQAKVTGLRLERRLVYFAPSLEMRRAKLVVPHFDYTGVAIVNGVPVPLERLLLPAVRGVGPRVGLTGEARGGRVIARAGVRGGQGPYTYSWSSCAGTLTPQQVTGGPSLTYSPAGRGPALGGGDRLTLLVHDANGLPALTRRSFSAGGAQGRATPPIGGVAVGNKKDVATEWIGNSQGLPNTQTNAYDFVDEMGDIAAIGFNWGDNDVFESDYVDPSMGGDDANWIDNADLIYHHGHGNADGVTTGATSGDGFVDYSQTRWGNGDLEWMAMKACQVLKTKNGAGLDLDQRWISNAFRGLHMMLGMVSNGYNTSGFGNEFGDNLADDDMKLRSAWVDAAESDQPDGVKYRYLGVIGPGNVTNLNDYFHGIGPVSKDIKTLTGYWYYTGTV